MIKERFEACRRRILHTFPERQIYVRSSGVVQYYLLAPWFQMLVVFGAALLILWSFINLCSLLFGNNPFKPANYQISKLKNHYEMRLGVAQTNENTARKELTQLQESYAVYSKSFEEKHAAISNLVRGSDLNIDVRSLTPTQYAQSQVLMTPSVRDAIPRTARRKLIQTADLKADFEIDNRLQNVLASQDIMLATAETQTLENIEKSRAILDATDLDVETILNANSFGKGGVFVAATNKLPIDELASGESLANLRMVNLKARMAEAEALNQAIQSTPLGIPVAGAYYRTSSFGKRKDPFTKRPAHHSGIDFGAYHLAPIIATAAGKVKFSGQRSGYGRVVEIEHGHGFVTRYAHLEKTNVKRGQVVKKGDELGGMGSTGRSTSTHLHYEVHFQGRFQNPDKFLKAGHYVQ